MNALVIIADIVKSRQISDRKNFQIALKNKLREISTNSKKNIESPYTLTMGDEFQAVYRELGSLFPDAWEIIEFLYPHKLRFSIGYDEIATSTNRKSAFGMDGPAFHSAREGLNKIKKYDKTLFQFFGSELPSRDLVNQSLMLIAEILDKWKRNTIVIMNGIMKNREIDVIAEKLDISTRAVYKNMHTNYIKTIIDLQTAIIDEIRSGIQLF